MIDSASAEVAASRKCARRAHGTLDARDARRYPEGLYVHLPFCWALCTYCDFARERYAHSGTRTARYLAALEKELAGRSAALAALAPEADPGARFAPRTIFLGGGTPSALSIEELAVLFDALERHVERARLEEFTIEANPGSADAAKLAWLRKRGVNRVSFGVQSFQPHLLKRLGRIHDAEQGREAVALARAAGFENVSIDLMHGLPGQSLDDLRRDLDEALALGVEHLSAYGLIYEKGTPLAEAAKRGAVRRLSNEEEAAHYRRVMETLEAGGLAQYEISNYARPGREARHNLIYWRNEAYLGVGVSAASYVNGTRRVNRRGLDAYLEAVEARGEALSERETLAPEARAREALVLALRLREGVHPKTFRAVWGLDLENGAPASRLAAFEAQGLMERTSGGGWRITRRGLPVADSILSEFV